MHFNQYIFEMRHFDVIVIGAGPAGLLAAGRAAELGGKVLVLEKMRREGRKLLITGKGRCNITNDASISQFIKHVYPNGRFLRAALSSFSSNDIIELLKEYGVDSILEREGRYFPVSNRSKDVLKALLQWVQRYNVEIRCNYRVEKLIVENRSIKGVKANDQKFLSNHVIMATGGKSYPATGSNGEGYELASSVGHTIVKPIPALVPLETECDIARKLQGLNLKNVKATVWVNERKKADDFGEMIFTHFGLSGPIILTLSRFIVRELQNKNRVEVVIDLNPNINEQELDKKLINDLNKHGSKKLINFLRLWLPASMIPVFVDLLTIDTEKECNQVSSKERKQILYLMKNLVFKISNYRSFKEAIITSGGISTKEISQKTMESKIVKGLYFAGEMIDLDAETGGYNLQIAYSTGWLAGNSCMTNKNTK